MFQFAELKNRFTRIFSLFKQLQMSKIALDFKTLVSFSSNKSGKGMKLGFIHDGLKFTSRVPLTKVASYYSSLHHLNSKRSGGSNVR
ncbi:MAG: hypothetical protein CR997_12040 [Acidobacteria bacterium]|nr:MAG: hypothetical protein CR997_12040 [Acidobacteriota bacterium]